ncbi:hypothetical protein [Methanobacterium paludis]|uniref:Uncharacterized protein n=1 Tax=Methanobacterium paludis (strain DSM 25820 / JCM 18151 / SWAN1) TaxID=868131 RepID=F6D1Q0_METPW|nr:hypothetical protein [Methanobacterium paludis]AEG17853.1 hypothetical protein MSWAN_0825 [Methanobacterium paludis]
MGVYFAEKDIKDRCGGYIQDSGWLIQYCFGKDETGEYLDYYATHRMTGDSHVRMYADGREESLLTLSSIVKISEDPVEQKRLEDEHDKYNRKVVKMLVDNGFDKFTMNMFLSAGMDKKMNEVI